MTAEEHSGRAAVRRLVRQTRSSQGLTITDTAKAAGIAVKSVYNLEKGLRWPLDRNLRSLERALGMRLGALDDVLTSEDPESITVDHLQDRPSDEPAPEPVLLTSRGPVTIKPVVMKTVQQASENGGTREITEVLDVDPSMTVQELAEAALAWGTSALPADPWSQDVQVDDEDERTLIPAPRTYLTIKVAQPLDPFGTK